METISSCSTPRMLTSEMQKITEGVGCRCREGVINGKEKARGDDGIGGGVKVSRERRYLVWARRRVKDGKAESKAEK